MSELSKANEKTYHQSRVEELTKEIASLVAEKVYLMRKHKLGVCCCRESESSNGWHHNTNCENYVIIF